MEKIYDKLVRDKIPEKIRNNGEVPFIRILNDQEYYDYLLKKDNEELLEVKNALTKEEVKKELADKLEIIRAMAKYNGFTLEDIIKEADLKKTKNGAFDERILLEKVIEKD